MGNKLLLAASRRGLGPFLAPPRHVCCWRPLRAVRIRSQPRCYHQAAIPAAPIPTPRPSRLRKALVFGAWGLFFSALGFCAGVAPVTPAIYSALAPRMTSDEESLRLYQPEDEAARQVEDFINRHPLTTELRGNVAYTESRPHLKIPEFYKKHNLTGGTLLGPGRFVVPPFAWNESGGKSMVSIAYLGGDLCGHPGIVHGGLLATMLDEGLARCCFAALPHNVGVTAKLDVNYRSPARAESYVVLRAVTTKVEGRKAWVEGRIETLVGPGETPTVLAEATALFISPRYAAMMPKFHAPSP